MHTPRRRCIARQHAVATFRILADEVEVDTVRQAALLEPQMSVGWYEFRQGALPWQG